MRFAAQCETLRTILCKTLIVTLVLGPDALLAAQVSTRLQVRLTAPISSDSTAGSRVVAQVVTPEEFAGDILEGRITSAKRNGGLQASSELGLTFETLYHRGQPYSIDGQVISYYNSKGEQNADDEGHIIKTSNKGLTTALVATGIGAALGAILSGGKNANTDNHKNNSKKKNDSQSNNNSRAVGAAKGAALGAAAGLAVGMTTDAPRIKFDTGSRLELDVRIQNRPRAQ